MKTLLTSFAVIGSTVLSAWLAQPTYAAETYVCGVNNNLNLRTYPGYSSNVIGWLPLNSGVRTSGETRGKFSYIEYTDKYGSSKQGWAATSKLCLSGSAKTPIEYKVCGIRWDDPDGGLVMRQRPTTGSARISVLENGRYVYKLGQSGKWFNIDVNGFKGWAHSKYLCLS